MSLSDTLREEIKALDIRHKDFLDSIHHVFHETPSLWYFVKTIETPSAAVYKMEVRPYSGLELPRAIAEEIVELNAKMVANYHSNIAQ